MTKTEKEVIKGVARCIKQIDGIKGNEISKMDQFHIDTARELLMKVIASNSYELMDNHRAKKIIRK